MRFPWAGRATWESQLIEALRRDGSGFAQPDLDAIEDRARFPLLGPTAGAVTLAKRRAGEARKQLEGYLPLVRERPSVTPTSRQVGGSQHPTEAFNGTEFCHIARTLVPLDP